MKLLCAITIGSALASVAQAPAQALCFYAGQFNAHTTIAQEYKDSRWVVRAKVLAGDNHWEEGQSWTIYRVRVLDAFKGSQPSVVRVFTYRDSGGFYMDRGLVPDLGGEYLLFLVPATQRLPASARGFTEVNYSCGQSKAWGDATPTEKAELMSLSKRYLAR